VYNSSVFLVRTLQKQTDSDWRDGFLFLGNQLALDFVNTHPAPHEEPVELLPDFDALLRWFQAAALLDSADAARLKRRWGESARAVQAVVASRDLRKKLRRGVLALEQGRPVPLAIVKELNSLMASHPLLYRLKAVTRNAWSMEKWFRPETPEDLLAPLVHDAAHMFAVADPERIRKCPNCVLHFQDTSKKGTRRWCSMRLCGNRFKVAAYAGRQRRRVSMRKGKEGGLRALPIKEAKAVKSVVAKFCEKNMEQVT
jgi:predicted RNA-binding Zn ribbon-like protein